MPSEAGAKILVVDDNPAGRYSTARILRAAGFTVLEAATGIEGLKNAAVVDAVVLDVNLPDIDGFEVCRRIRAGGNTARIPVIHLSATFVKDVDKVQGLEAGADGYLTHPVEPPVLVATINAFLRARRAEDEMRRSEAKFRAIFDQERERLLAGERAAREDAERANRLKDEFLATLSHELRTPLNAIVGWSEILRSSTPSAKDLAEGIEAIERNAKAQAQLISDLLDVSRITSGKLRLDARPMDLAATITEALEALVNAIQAKEIRLERDLRPEAASIVGDPQRIQQVLWNLVNNAVKFTPRGGTIRVTLDRAQPYARITVADTGQGIKPDFLPYIFERFRQEDATSKRNQGGLGLGLAIVKHLVEMHGGTITAHSEGEGRGASFVVQIPVATIRSDTQASGVPSGETKAITTAADADADADAQAALSPSALRGIRVLLVEDDDDARNLLRRSLGRAEAEVLDAASVTVALDFLASFRPHVLISDVGMPELDGYDLIREVRARGLTPAKLPAIALTAFARSEDEERSLQAGFQVHLSKPVDQHQLIAAVASVVTGNELQSASGRRQVEHSD